MGKKLYVGNLSYSVDDHSLNQNFSDFGTVSSAKVMMDRDSGRSKGFGFVEMSSDAEAQAAISGMNGKIVDGRDMVVNEARPMEPRTGGGGGGGRYGGGGTAPAVAAVVAMVAAATVTKAPALQRKKPAFGLVFFIEFTNQMGSVHPLERI
jgi:cold-inducible RNA-binding protein